MAEGFVELRPLGGQDLAAARVNDRAGVYALDGARLVVVGGLGRVRVRRMGGVESWWARAGDVVADVELLPADERMRTLP